MPLPLIGAVAVGAALLAKAAGGVWLWRRYRQPGAPSVEPTANAEYRQTFIAQYPYEHVAGAALRERLGKLFPGPPADLEAWSVRAWAGWRSYLLLHVEPNHEDPGPLGVPSVLIDEAWLAFRTAPEYPLFCRMALGDAFPTAQAPWNRDQPSDDELRRTARRAQLPGSPWHRPFLFTLNDGLPGVRAWTDTTWRRLVLPKSA